MCPVTAYLQWLEVAGIAHGPVFRKLDRWGHLGDSALNSNSLVGLLRRMLERAGVPAALCTGPRYGVASPPGQPPMAGN
ncbi:hypothetical protein [Pseudomonas peli]|uniref:hypothetical protein n=1 Tax=Pseudomonas peli TaxID=592361 RepID=UPI0024AE78E2|nr:hypothetical protein [Pseudomonas peli]